jgi:transcriptional regulator with XRE-family HTH domain
MRKQSEGVESGSVMDDDRAVARGEAIRRRRFAQGFKSLREFSERTGVSREAVTNAERGEASEGTYHRLEAFLDQWEHTVGEDQPPVVEQMTFIVEGDFGVKVTVSGPVSDREALEASVANIIRSIRKSSPDTP